MTDTNHERDVITAWALRYGVLPDIADAFAHWYETDSRNDAYATAYDVFRTLCGGAPVSDVQAQITHHEANARAVSRMGSRELAAFYGWDK